MNGETENTRQVWLGIWTFITVSLLTLANAQSQSDFLLGESDMVGYKLQNQFANDWIVGADNLLKSTIRQTWVVEGASDTTEVDVEYCVFDSEAEALAGAAYASRSHAEIFVWGSVLGTTFGDASWTTLNRYGNASTIMVRGNVGVQINVLYSDKVDQHLQRTRNQVLEKINSNLSADILSFEETIRQKQISKNDYESITNPIAGIEAMNGFSPIAVWDSKWLIEQQTVAMGIRKEWQNAAGAVVGIDICKLESDKTAKSAGENRSRNSYIYDRLFELGNLDSVRSILDKWKTQGSRFDDNMFSVVGYKGNIVVHVTLYDLSQIDTDHFYSILAKLSEQVSNF